MTYSSREALAMAGSETGHVVSFGKRNGCYMSRCAAVLLGVVFVSSVVASGLLVYYYSPEIGKALQDVKTYFYSTPKTETKFSATIEADNIMIMTSKKPEPTTTTTIRTTTTATTTTTTELPTTTTTQQPTTLPTEAPTATAGKSKQYQRLPRALKPLHYLVKLQPFINGNFSIVGYVEIEIEVLQPTNNITLHIADIITKNESIKLVPMDEIEAPEMAIMKHEYDHEHQFYIAYLEKPLQEGRKYVLSMDFLAYLNDQLHGFYRSYYTDDDGTGKYLAGTQFQATDARRAFPCFDEPGLKATFQIFLAREDHMSSISNMPLAETSPMLNQPGWVWDRYHTSVPMSTYLIAFVVSDFANMSYTGNDRWLFRVWARESALQQADYSLDIGPKILSHFEEYFNIAFPLPKQDMIALPDFGPGAMENWGLVTYRETLMLYKPGLSAAFNKQLVASVVSHELAHQWFGNLVTPKWWTDIWLNEGFASYVQYIGVNHVEPTWKIMEQFVLKRIQGVFGVDSLESSHPIRHDAVNADRLAYDKGSAIIRMMSHFLGDSTFRKGLNNYLHTFQWGNAEQDDLWQYLTMAAHEDAMLPKDVTVKMIMDTWTLQMGYPVIEVVRSSDGTSATVTQKRFLLVKNENSSDSHTYRWWVPLTYTSQESPDFNHTQAMMWMKDSETEVTIPSLPSKDQWVIFNLQETGYYRVNYDDHNWDLLIRQLNTDHTLINTINRAQIIDDAMDLAQAGELPYHRALSVNSYLNKETEYVPWTAALDNLSYLKSMFTRTSGYGALKTYLLTILLPLYESVGFEDSPNDPWLDQYKRQKALSWTCSLGHRDCLNNAAYLFSLWMNNPENSSIVSPNLKSMVYCRAIAEGGEAEWTFAWQQYLQSNVGSEKEQLLSAMGCTRQLWLLSRYLEMAFQDGSGIRKQDTSRVFSAVASNPVGQPLAWNFLQEHWGRISNFFGKILIRLVKSVCRSFNTQQELRELIRLQEDHGAELRKEDSIELQQVVENAQNNVEWMNKNYEVILHWLLANGYSSSLDENI